MLTHLSTLEDYEPLIGAKTLDRLLRKCEEWKGLQVVNFNSTYYGGGVAELLTGLTLLMNSVGIQAEWRVLQGRPDFFNITKKLHHALQGAEINLSRLKTRVFEEVNLENALRNRIDHDFVIVHDPQPLPLIDHYAKKCPWIWRCHVELSTPHRATWKYLKGFIKQYDAAILSCKKYAQKLKIPQLFFMPAIDPFNVKNRELSDRQIHERLRHYDIPEDLPIVAQISRFDRWKDPQGVVKAFKMARREVDATLVLLGNFAADDPEGASIYEELARQREERILVLANGDDTALVNALQRRAAVVLQKSLREGFGLTIAEAMWKGTPVIGGNVGGIRLQIEDGVNGFLVSSPQQAARRIVELLKNKPLREKIGRQGQKSVASNFLLTRYLEQYLDLFARFQTVFKLTSSRC